MIGFTDIPSSEDNSYQLWFVTRGARRLTKLLEAKYEDYDVSYLFNAYPLNNCYPCSHFAARHVNGEHQNPTPVGRKGVQSRLQFLHSPLSLLLLLLLLLLYECSARGYNGCRFVKRSRTLWGRSHNVFGPCYNFPRSVATESRTIRFMS